MRHIRWGLEKHLDVSVYAKPEFSWEQMEQIRFGLEQGFAVSVYAKPEFSWGEDVGDSPRFGEKG
jgi:hypothetical protein